MRTDFLGRTASTPRELQTSHLRRPRVAGTSKPGPPASVMAPAEDEVRAEEHHMNKRLKGLGLVATSALLVTLGSQSAFADNVQNSVSVNVGNDTFTLPGSTTVGYRIGANSGDGEPGCNASLTSPATVTINAPAGVTANPSSLNFTTCGNTVFQNVVFTATAAGNYNITVSVADTGPGSYNTNPAAFTLKVLAGGATDTTAPVIASHGNETAEATGPSGAAVAYISPATSDAVDGPGTANCTPASGSNFPLGTTTVTCNATDAAGNAATPTTFTVTVRDTTAPVIASHGNETAEATGPSGATVTYTAPATSDAVDGTGTASCAPASGSTFALGTTTVTCDAADAAGNAATSTTFTVTVADTTAPVIASHGNETAEATGPSGAAVAYISPATSDAVDGPGTANCTPASGSNFPLGTTTVTCNATDAAGNAATPTTFTVTVRDTTAPVIASHGNETAEATGPSGATVTYTAPATSDAVDGTGTASCAPASGSTFALGTTTVTCDAADAAGNAATSTTFTVTVADTTAPVIASHGSVTATATSQSSAIVNYTSPTTSDAVDGPGTATCLPVSGSTFTVGATTVTCNATDAAGNAATPTTFSVIVSYAWSGFYQPIDMNVSNRAKAGSAIPVKFSLGGNQGLNIFSSELPNPKFTFTSCLGGAVDDIEQTVTAGASSLTYDAAADQYVYVWKTDKSWAGKCGNLSVTLKDGSTHTAAFTLTK